MLDSAAWRRTAALTAIIAGSFCIYALLMLIMAVHQGRQETPLDSAAIRQLKEQLAQRPNDEDLKLQTRLLDLDLRQSYFSAHAMVQRAGWLLVAGGVVLFLALKAHGTLAAAANTAAPAPVSPHAAVLARWSLALAAVAVAGGLASMSLVGEVRLPPPPPASVLAAEAPPTWERLFANWPSFRGAAGDGVVRQESPLPAAWDGIKGENILWRAGVTLPGHNSPIFWEGRLYLSGADEKHREVYCFDAGTGERVWTLPLPMDSAREVSVFADTGMAASTMACDGRRLYAIFASGDLFAMSLAGEILWQRSLGVPDSQYGYASSLAINKGKVIVQLDQGEAESGKSALLAFDGVTGRPAWRSQRMVGGAWSSPIVAPTRRGDRIFACGNPLVAGYDPANGQEMWSVALLEGDVAPSPIFSDGVVYVAGDRAKAAAIPDAGGKVKPTWTHEENLPEIVSPLCDGENLLLVNGAGTMACFKASDGSKRWEHELQTPVRASPLLVGEVVYLTDEKGVTHLFRLAEPAYKELAANALGDKISASPAVADGRLYFRTESQQLICVAAPPAGRLAR